MQALRILTQRIQLITASRTATYLSENSAQYIRAIDLKALLSPALSILPASQFKGLGERRNGWKYSSKWVQKATDTKRMGNLIQSCLYLSAAGSASRVIIARLADCKLHAGDHSIFKMFKQISPVCSCSGKGRQNYEITVCSTFDSYLKFRDNNCCCNSTINWTCLPRRMIRRYLFCGLQYLVMYIRMKYFC